MPPYHFPASTSKGQSRAKHRYSYTLNNPVRYTDPTGHIIPLVVAGLLTEEALAYIVVAGLLLITINYVVACSQMPSCNLSLGDLAQEINSGAIGARSFVDGLGYILQAKTGKRPLDGIRKQLDQDDLEAAQQEAGGEVVSTKSDDTPYDHQTKVKNAQRGLSNRIDRINARLRDSRVSETEKEALRQEKAEAQELLDYTRKYVP